VAPIVLTSSTQGLFGRGGDGSGALDGYARQQNTQSWGLMRTYAHWLAPHRIRVNTIHPTGVRTPMVVNQIAEDYFATTPAAGRADGRETSSTSIWSNPNDVSQSGPVFWCRTTAAFITGVAFACGRRQQRRSEERQPLLEGGPRVAGVG